MNSQVTFTKRINNLGVFIIFIVATLAFGSAYAQTGKMTSTEVAQNERIIKGNISNETGPLESVNIILKGTKIGTATDSKGEFTFPKPLKTGDVLLISYLGYEPQEARIKDDTMFLRLVLTEDLIEFSGALNSDTPYKSKRNNH